MNWPKIGQGAVSRLARLDSPCAAGGWLCYRLSCKFE